MLFRCPVKRLGPWVAFLSVFKQLVYPISCTDNKSGGPVLYLYHTCYLLLNLHCIDIFKNTLYIVAVSRQSGEYCGNINYSVFIYLFLFYEPRII